MRYRLHPAPALAFATAAMSALVGTFAVAADSQVGVAGTVDKHSAEKAFPARTP